jgi:hypothetical protein
MAHEVYICHSTRDQETASLVCTALEQSGVRCWIAPRDVPPGAVWLTALQEAIAGSRLVVLIFSSFSNESTHVRREVERTIELGIPILPLSIENLEPGPAFSYLLGNVQWIRTSASELTSHLSAVVDSAKGLLAGNRVKQPPQRKSAVSGDRYDVFISYRRESGASEARAIRAELRQRNFRVFLDVDDLKSGHFDEALLARIAEAPNFIVILSPNSLDRCADKDDWLRREITQALRTGRNMVPIMLRGFEFSSRQNLPQELQELPTHHSVEYNHTYFNAMIEKIVGYLRT